MGRECEHNAFQPLFLRKLLCQIDQRTMAQMQAVKVAQRYRCRLALFDSRVSNMFHFFTPYLFYAKSILNGLM